MMTKMRGAVLGVTLAVAAAGTVGCGSPPEPASPEPTAAAGGEKDTDGDGIPDSADKCPAEKEDGLGSEPKDGCPNKPWARHPGPN
jgi:hypothetical protein